MKTFLIAFLGLVLSVSAKAQSNTHRLLGKWMLEELSIGDTTVTADACLGKSYVIFKNDNTTVSQWFHVNIENICEPGKIITQSFRIDEGNLLKNDEGTIAFKLIDDNILVLKPAEIKTNDDAAIHIQFKKLVYSRSRE